MTETLVKIRFELDGNDWYGDGTETLWAMPITDGELRVFQLRNSPFFMSGINHLDVVRATPVEKSYGMFDFVEAVERGGHSTYMLLMQPDDARRNAYWNMLKTLGCSYEGAHVETSLGGRLLYSVDVPPTTDLHEVYEILERGEREGVWVFQEGYANVDASSPKGQ
jgi:hypothetical protein